MVLNILQYLNFVQAFLWLSRVVLCHFCRIHAASSNIVNLIDVAENSSSKMFLEDLCDGVLWAIVVELLGVTSWRAFRGMA